MERKVTLFFIAFVALLLSACGTVTDNAPMLTMTARASITPTVTPTPTPTLTPTPDFPALTATARFDLVLQMEAQAAAVAAQATLAAIEAARTAQAVQLTQQALSATQAARETQAALYAVETERAWVQTQAANDVQSTATQVAMLVWIAERTATATFEAGRANMTATADASIAEADATAIAAHAVMADNAARRDTITTEFTAWWQYFAWPLYALITAGLLLVVYRLYINRDQIIHRDAKGALPALIHRGQVVVPDIMIEPWHDPAQPRPLALAAHSQAASENARVRALMALPPGTGERMAEQFAEIPQPAQIAAPQAAAPPQIRIINPANDQIVDGWVREVEEKYLTTGGSNE